jgi:mono/diheme cytochrome c family protein
MTHPRAALALAAAVLVAWPAPAPAADTPDLLLAAQARAVLRKHCAACHDGDKARAGLRVLNAAGLTRPDRRVVTPGEPDRSELLQLVECGTMPPGTRPKVPESERKILRAWIDAKAPDFPPPYGDTYALATILLDARAERAAGRDPAAARYVTLNHLLADEKDAADLDLFRAALTKALNQLSTGPKVVAPTPVDPDATVFRINLRDLGWDYQPFAKSDVNLFDLLLLDYPLAPPPERSPLAGTLAEEYLSKVPLVRPVPYVRGDWLAAVATQAPLYEDMLRLPPTFAELEQRAGVGGGTKPARAGLTKSGVLNCNRIVERRATDKGLLWWTYDLAGTSGAEVLLRDAAAPKAGGEAIFRLPNGLPGYFSFDGRGMRREEIPCDHLQKPFAGQGARNGLSCIACHTEGLMKFEGDKAFEEKYPDAATLAGLLDRDNEGFAAALREVRKGVPEAEPLGPAARRFRDALTGRGPGPVRFVALDVARRKPPVWDASIVFADGAAALARLDRGGAPPEPVPPVDALGRPAVVGKAAVDCEVRIINVKTGKAQPSFRPGDKVAIQVENTGEATLYYELVWTQANGKVQVWPLPEKERKGKLGVLPAREKRTFKGEDGNGYDVTELEPGDWPTQQCTIYASDKVFPPGTVVSMGDGRPPGEYVADRFVHTFYEVKDGTVKTLFDPAKMVKKTIRFETQSK